MREKLRAAVLLVVLLLTSSRSEARARAVDEAARQLLRQSIELYLVGRYQEAAERLRPLVESRVLEDQEDQKEALGTYGTSLYLSGARAGAERAFRSLLQLDARATLDPSFVRPEVVRFFEEVRQRQQAEVQAFERRGSRYAAVNLLPPWGQFQNGQRAKGYLLLGGELGFGAVSVTTFALLWSWRGETAQFLGKEHAYRPLSVLNTVSSALTVAFVVYGIVDGLYYYYRLPRARSRHAWQPAQPGALGLSF